MTSETKILTDEEKKLMDRVAFQLKHAPMSRYHLALTFKASGYSVEDLIVMMLIDGRFVPTENGYALKNPPPQEKVRV